VTFTKRISIERYRQPEIAEYCAGLIEGETEDGQSWIIYMDAHGKPNIYWPRRDESGAVIGEPVSMAADQAKKRRDTLARILASADPLGRLQAALDAANARVAELEGAPDGGKPIE